MIIRVRGVPGSGKTYIARALREHGVKVIDTDDVITEAYDELAKSAKSKDLFTVDHVLELAERRILHKVYGSKGLTVVVGVTLHVPSSDETFFIDVSEKLHDVYERTVKRELKKYALMRDSVSRLPVNQVAPYLACKLHLNAFDPRQDYRHYVALYEKALASERKRATVIEQGAIINHILQYHRRR